MSRVIITYIRYTKLQVFLLFVLQVPAAFVILHCYYYFFPEKVRNKNTKNNNNRPASLSEPTEPTYWYLLPVFNECLEYRMLIQ